MLHSHTGMQRPFIRRLYIRRILGRPMEIKNNRVSIHPDRAELGSVWDSVGIAHCPRRKPWFSIFVIPYNLTENDKKMSYYIGSEFSHYLQNSRLVIRRLVAQKFIIGWPFL